MYSIRQEELFSLQELMEMSPDDKYGLIFSELDLAPALRVVNKQTHRGRPEELNTAAMIYALLISKIERIPTTKDMLRRLKSSVEFRMTCRFRGSDALPSEASFSRLYTKLADSGVLWTLHEQMIRRAYAAGFISGDILCMDSSHIEADENSPARKKAKTAAPDTPHPALITEAAVSVPAPSPVADPRKQYKRGRPKAEDMERRRQERAAWEASLPLFERKIEEMLPLPFEDLQPHIPKDPSSSSKTGSDGKQKWWYGYKLHALADSKSQYLVSALFSSAHVSDGRIAIPLLKKFTGDLPNWSVRHVLADAGYDFMAVYKQVREMNAWPLIDFNERSDKPPEGYNEQFSPICEKGHAFVYDSFDAQYKRLKFTRPKECATCPLPSKDQCQKIKKIKVGQDLRRFTVPARASQSYEETYDQRTAVERIFAYLKEYYGLGRSEHRGKRAEVDAALSVLSYTLCRFAVDRKNSQSQKQAS
ncbi:transposase [Cohnella sp. 56]|uniref:transposase n=1 Tax=Cohnella sp. 56 TaxID=3113722 RepID=UPI0030E8674D